MTYNVFGGMLNVTQQQLAEGLPISYPDDVPQHCTTPARGCIVFSSDAAD